jgi:hypothetical protein
MDAGSGQQRMVGWRRGLAAAAVMLSVTQAGAEEDWSGTYLCVQEVAGGLKYDEDLARWKSTTFDVRGSFVLKARKVGEHPLPGAGYMVGDYETTITELGEDERPCAPLDMDDHPLNFATITCRASLTEYRVNLFNKRFLSTYLQGYLDWGTGPADTPALVGGRCTVVK